MTFDSMAHDQPVLWYGLVALVSYLLGSIPFGVVLTRAAGLGDLRGIGSGNIGATNVLRTGRKDLALLTLLLDALKAGFAVVAVMLLFSDLGGRDRLAAVAGGSAFLGHLFPVWLQFRGGKGVATFFGVLLTASWPVGIAAGAVWLTMAAVFRYSSLASLTAAALAPTFVLLLQEPRWIDRTWVLIRDPRALIWLVGFMSALILIRHRANIARLRQGREPRIGAGSS